MAAMLFISDISRLFVIGLYIYKRLPSTTYTVFSLTVCIQGKLV